MSRFKGWMRAWASRCGLCGGSGKVGAGACKRCDGAGGWG